MKEMTVDEVAAALESGEMRLLDVRTPAEFREKHIPGAESMPLDRIEPDRCGDGPVVLMCLSGKRSRTAAEKLEAAGKPAPRVLAGGIEAWERGGRDVVRGRSVMSLERQVRIAAGALVVLGVVLGTWVHGGFHALAAFVGAGLVFAGITDTCGMGMLLAKAPWNR